MNSQTPLARLFSSRAAAKLEEVIRAWRSVETAAFLFWFSTMTAVPIAIWTVGESSVALTMLLATVAQALLVFILLASRWGVTRAAATALGITLLGWLVEWIGSTTGWPFGAYHYTTVLQPQVGHVPLLVPLAWFMMLPVAWGVADGVTKGGRGWRFVLLSAAAMTAWDLFLDPQMVNWNFWVWDRVPAVSYFGIPWLNFLGWFVSAAIMTALLRPPPMEGMRVKLLILYTIIWLLQTGGLLLFWGLPGPAVAGFLGMGTMVILSIRRFHDETISQIIEPAR